MINRHSIRLPNYDYSQNGAYFLTVCTQDRRVLFGNIHDGNMQLNHAGEMIDHWWQELLSKYSHIELDTYVIMPDHMHGIIAIVDDYLEKIPISQMVQWFKTMTMNAYIQGVKSGQYPPFEKRIWQRNYYEHVIRDENDLRRIQEYITNNPMNWSYEKMDMGP